MIFSLVLLFSFVKWEEGWVTIIPNTWDYFGDVMTRHNQSFKIVPDTHTAEKMLVIMALLDSPPESLPGNH